MSHAIQFTVIGTPVPKGSAKAFVRGKHAAITASNVERLRPWEALVRDAATQAGAKIVSGPVEVNLVFSFRRPKAHFRTGKNAHILRDGYPEHHTQKPDLDKLERAILDGITGVVVVDDSQVARITSTKQWLYSAEASPRAFVEVKYL